MALNFNNICRLCMGKKDALLPLFNERKGQIISLPAKIMNFVPIMKLFSGDGLPAQVCRQCVRLVNKSYKFKQQCESSDATLRQYLNNQSLSESTDEILHSVFRTDNGECWKFSTAVKKEAEEDSSIDDTAGPDNSDIDHEDHRISDTESVKGEQEWTSPEAGPSAGDPVKNQKKSDSPTRKLSKEKKPAKKWTNFVNVHETYEIKSEDEKPNDAEDVDNTTPRESANNHDLTNEIKVEPIVKTEAKTPRVKEKKIFLCHDCGKNFNRKQHLLLHLRTHTGEKPFSCKVCGESFGMSSNLNKHMRIHTGERPFLCTMCGKCFGRSDTLTKHMRCHTGEKPFHCNVCGNNFGRSSTLINHMRTHLGEKPYLCTDCGRRFVQSYDLTKHMRSHTGEKPYICTVCRMSFGQKHTLNKHMRNHTGELQFCPAGFQRTVPSEFQRTVTSEFQRTGSSEFQRTVPSEFQRTVPFVYYRPPVTDLSVERSAVLIGGGSQVQ